MAGTAEVPRPSSPRRSTAWRLTLVLVLIAVVAVSATLYVVTVQRPSPDTAPTNLAILIAPSAGNNTTVFHFTAEATDDRDPASAIQVRWDWESDGTWDTPWAVNKTADHTFTVPATYRVAMEAMDSAGLTANASTLLTVSPVLLPPRILRIDVSPSSGTNATAFNFTAVVTDARDPATAIQVRWDWESDGLWETNWSTTKTASHRFPVPGNYTVAVQAKNTAGLTARASILLRVAPAGPPPPPLRIGTILSLTGALQAFGPSQQNAVVMAVNEINANGGVDGQPIQLFTMDDATNPSTAAQAATTLVTVDHVAAIIGATGSGQCVQIVPIAAASHVVEISPSCTSPIFSNLTLTGGWFARTIPSDSLQAVVAADFEFSNLSQRWAAVIGINNAYGVAVANAFAQNFTLLGGTMTSRPRIVNEVSGGVTNYTPDLVAVLNTNPAPQVVYLAAYPPDGVLMMQDWHNGIATYPAWANVKWIFSEGLYDQQNFINPLVPTMNVGGFLGTAPAAYAGLEPPAYGPWASRYQALYGSLPTLFAANAYDAAYLVALAAEASGNTTGWGIRARLRAIADPPGTVVGPNGWGTAVQLLGAGGGINYNGASGSVDIGAHGDVPSSFIIWGVNATNQLVTREFFNESLVVALSPPNTFRVGPAVAGPSVAAAWTREPDS